MNLRKKLSGLVEDTSYKNIRLYNLEENINELETYGFTIIPPEKIANKDFLKKIRTKILQLCKERTGEQFYLKRNGKHGHYKAQPQTDSQFLLYYLLMEGPLFEEWLMNPILNSLVDYLMKGNQQLSSMTSFVKWQGDGYGETLGLHSDTPPNTAEGLLPTAWSDVCNATYCLTDYTLDNGALAIVPGSHRFARQPKFGEGIKRAIPVEAKAGSLIAWHGNVWHGAFPKETEGLRLNLTTYFCHKKLKTQEAYQWCVTEEMIKRNPPGFAKLVAADDPMGWDEHGPNYARGIEYKNK